MAQLVDLRAQQERMRQELNLKNLRRHDKSISAIVDSTSFASIYHNDGSGWVKANVEGPMFLFTRSKAPQNGFFILNRNGLEYVQEFIKSDSEVRMEGDFILYEPSPDCDKATGIWVYDEKERKQFFSQMEAMKVEKAARSVVPAANGSTAKSISLDDLFGTKPATAPQAPAQPTASLLDTLFANAASSSSKSTPTATAAQPTPKPQPKSASDLLAMIGGPAAAPKPKPAPAPAAATPAAVREEASTGAPKPNFAPPILSHDVFDMLPPLKSTAATTTQTQTEVSQTVTPKAPQSRADEPAVSQSTTEDKGKGRSVFPMPPSSMTKSTPTKAAPQKPKPAAAPASVPAQPPHPSAPVSNGHAAAAHDAQKAKKPAPAPNTDMILPVVDQAIAAARVGIDSSVASGEPVGRDEFVRSVQDLLQNPTFVRGLYARYLRRFAEECEK